MRSSGAVHVATVGLVLGLLLLAAPWVAPMLGSFFAPPPVVLPATFRPDAEVALPLRERLIAHDAACARGDVRAHAEVVSATYRASLEKTAAVFDRPLDGAMLRGLSEGDRGLAAMLAREGCRGFADGDRACFVGPSAALLRGCTGVLFVRDGDSFRIDRVVHLPEVDAEDEDALAAFARALLASRGN